MFISRRFGVQMFKGSKDREEVASSLGVFKDTINRRQGGREGGKGGVTGRRSGRKRRRRGAGAA